MFFRAPAFFPRANETIRSLSPGSGCVAILRNRLSVFARDHKRTTEEIIHQIKRHLAAKPEYRGFPR